MATKLACIAGLTTGVALLLAGGGGAPRWLAGFQVVALMLGALAFGFSLLTPRIPAWMCSRPVVGVSLIYMGVISMFLPPNVVASAVLIGTGTRLIMTTDNIAVRVVRSTTLVRSTTGKDIQL